jgi:hypothetical protein
LCAGCSSPWDDPTRPFELRLISRAMEECIDAVKDIPRGLHSYDNISSFSLPVFKTLYSRAWTFQEMVASPRVASYSSDELQWHCRRVSLCECDQWHDFSKSLDVSIVKDRCETLVSEHKGTMMQQEEYFTRWYRILRDYTHLKLTISSNRLPALSALAQHFQNYLRDVYIAGLWKSDMRHGLRWRRGWEQDRIGYLSASTGRQPGAGRPSMERFSMVIPWENPSWAPCTEEAPVPTRKYAR